jgi:ABC-type transport system involved in multi-copper enzyme maturation permease subunit
MFGVIVNKEILEAVRSYRFIISTLLCLSVIPLGFYVNLKEYEKRRNDYQEAVNLSRQRVGPTVDADIRAEGYRPPSVLSIFSLGLEYYYPNKMVTSRGGTYQISNEQGIDNPQSLLFGKIDLLFNVSFVISLLALILSFNVVSGEKEDGTLRMIFANPVHRWEVLLGKITGNYLLLLVPFVLSVVVALIILAVSGIMQPFSGDVLLPMLVILGVTFLFILGMFTLGVLVSTLTHRSIISMITLMLLWTFLVLLVPKMSPMVAEIVYPIESQQVIELRKSLLRETLEKERSAKRGLLYEQIAVDLGVDPNSVSTNPRTAAEQKLHDEFDKGKVGIEEEYRQRIDRELAKIEEEYANRRALQQAIAVNFSRISPVSCYTYIVTEVSATGMLELENLYHNAQQYQNEVKENIYDKFIVKSYGGRYGSATTETYAPGFDPRRATIPSLEYGHFPLSTAVNNELLDIVILIVFTIVLFSAAVLMFVRYDVR